MFSLFKDDTFQSGVRCKLHRYIIQPSSFLITVHSSGVFAVGP